ncbi:hypothetical protein SUGI_0197490 [Cryptomeria japonica]|nr:hypothetical protein SUGI_0197490 [Cryptomeria japonica]
METSTGHEYHVRIIKAEADGVAPSLLVSAPKNGPQYLFNVPEGFSRLVLEHKIRPSARLASVFLTSLRPHCAGGLGGLLLRLAGDGHGQLQLIGPDCTSAYLHSLRHIIYWRHPKVFICDCQPFRPLPVFDDDFVSICPILPSGKILACPWCKNSENHCKENELHNFFSEDGNFKSRFECMSSDGMSCSNSNDEMDGTTSRSFKGSVRLGSEIDESVTTRNMFHNDHCQSSSKLLYKGIETNEGKKVQVKKFGSDTCTCGRKLNGNRKRDILGHELSPTVEKNYECKEACSIMGRTMEPSSELFDEKDFIAYASTKSSSAMEGTFSTCKRKRESLKNDSLLGLEAMDKFVSEALQDSTHPSIRSCRKCCFKSSNKLVLEPTIQVRKVTPDSGVQEQCPMNGWHKHNSELISGKDSVVPQIGMRDNLTGKDLQECGLSKVQQNVHLCNETTCMFTPGGQENESNWSVNNSMEVELPNLPDGAIPLYIKNPEHDVTVICEDSIEKIPLASDRGEDYNSSIDAREIIGFVCYMKKLRSAFIIVNCETPECVDKLLQNSLLSCISSDNDQNGCLHSVCAFIHLTPPSVLKTEKYMAWMRSLGDDALHIIMHDGSAEYGFLYSFSSLAKMNMVNKEIFPLPFNAVLCNQQMDAENFEHFGFGRRVKSVRLLTCVAFQSIQGGKVQVVLDDSMCQGNMDTELIQESFAKSRPDLAEKTKKVAKDFLVTSQGAGMWLSANKMAALSLREKLLLQRKLAVKEATTQGVSAVPSNISVANNLNYSGTENICSSLCNGRTKSAEFRLLFLGTGCAEPMKQRGSSGILLEMYDKGYMLLDAGEGVAGQILRAFGKHNMRKVVEELQCVWISHKHADHVLGIISIIAARPENGLGILIVGSTQVHEWLQEVNCIYGKLGYSFPSFTFVHCQQFMACQQGSSISKRIGCEDLVSRLLENLQLCSMRCVWVDHCFQSCGLVLSSMSGWSMVYSGDTRPCKALIEAGMGCTLLIHEATFEDKFGSHARAKRHSTISEALEVGQQMGAKHVILTHFSQRSQKIMGINFPENISASFAYDGMVIYSRNLQALPGLMHCLVSLFDEYNGTMSCQDSSTNSGNERRTDRIQRLSNERRTNRIQKHTAIAIPSIKLQSLEQCHILDHIGWNDLESEIAPSHTAVVIPSLNIQSSEQGSFPKHIRWNDSDSEDGDLESEIDPSHTAMIIPSLNLQSSEQDQDVFAEHSVTLGKTLNNIGEGFIVMMPMGGNT